MARHTTEPVDPSRPAVPRSLRLDVGRVAALVPVAVLLACGVAVATTGAPAPVTQPTAAADNVESREPLAVVPEQAVREPASVAGADGAVAPALQISSGGSSGSPVRLDTAGIPARALTAYRASEAVLAEADPGCRLPWSLVAAIGRVESNHGSFGGNRLDTGGVARPGIIGIALDGTRNTARILDSDGGRWDGDATYDRAVGPMQFIPGTWRGVGVDAEPDGARNPQDIDDAGASTGVYLCSGPGDLTQASDLYRAVRRYNNSDAYVRTVLAIADAYARGVRALPASALPAARVSTPVSVAPVLGPSQPAPAEAAPAAPAPAATEPAPAATTPAPSPTTPPVAATDPAVPGVPLPEQSSLPTPPATEPICTDPLLGTVIPCPPLP